MGTLLKQPPITPVPPLGTVLVVDDDSMVRECVAVCFSSLGFNVIQASDGVNALEIYRAEGDGISLVFMDIVMPGMDGITATQKIREINPSAKVILSSGGTAGHVLSDANPNAFLPKPYKHQTFCDVVRRVMTPALSSGIPLLQPLGL
jgi:CheY-like chemotaxis protein